MDEIMKMQSPILPNYSLLPIPSSPTAAATATANPSFLLLLTTNPSISKSPTLAGPFPFSFKNPKRSTVSQFRFRPHVHCASSNKVDSLPQDDDDEEEEEEDEDEDEDEDDDDTKLDTDSDDDIDIDTDVNIDIGIDTGGIDIEIEKTGSNCRRIRSEIGIEAPLNTVWNLLTDYERLADFIPGLAVCQLLHKTDNYARLFQIGEQNLAFGLKFNAKGILDCYETPLESLPNNLGQKRDIEFNMVEGDFEIFQGKWSLQQLNREVASGDSLIHDQQVEMHTTLAYLVDVKPKLWLPVRLVEGRLCKEIKMNLACIRQEALKLVTHNTLHTTR